MDILTCLLTITYPILPYSIVPKSSSMVAIFSCLSSSIIFVYFFFSRFVVFSTSEGGKGKGKVNKGRDVTALLEINTWFPPPPNDTILQYACILYI